MSNNPQELDEEVFGSFVDARYAEVSAITDQLVEYASESLDEGLTPAQAAAFVEYSIGKSPGADVRSRAVVGLANAVVQLALARRQQR